jgi:peptidoglycan/xylan/chitin deacetylase (PgdA/CDA1 family)
MKWTTRNILAYLYAKGLLFSGASERAMKKLHQSGDVLSLYFHNPSKELFEQTLKWLIKQGVNFISTEQLLGYFTTQSEIPMSSVVLTVDDGWRDNKENLIATANQYKVPVTIFITTEPVLKQKPYWWTFNQQINEDGIGFMKTSKLKTWTNIERITYLNGYGYSNAFSNEAMDENDVKEADRSKYVFIESHTVSHPILTKCSDEEAEDEIRISKKQLEEILGRKIKGFAYPNGSYGEREIALLKKHGYQYGYTTKSGYITLEANRCLYSLPRIEVLEEVSFAENLCRMSGLWLKNKHDS